jgi:DNA polymerase-1
MILKDYNIVTEPSEVPGVLQALERVPQFALDLETTSLDFNRGTIHGVALATENQEWYVTLGAEKAILPHLNDVMKGRQVLMHNGCFDNHFLARYGIKPDKLADTMIGQFLVDENQRIGLKELAHTKLGIREELPDFKELMHWAKKLTNKKKLADVSIFDIPLDPLAEYAARDARLTYDLWLKTQHELEREGMTQQFFDVEMPFVYTVMGMESAGFWIDQALLKQIGIDFESKKQEAYNRWMEITEGVNPNSPKQLAHYLYEVMGYDVTRTTDSGDASTDITALNRLLHEDKNGAVQALIDFRKFDKLISTYVTSFGDQLFNGRLHGGFNQTGTVTGRLSSSGPNLQNIPGRGEEGGQVRSLFAAPPGKVMLVIDYSQIELRLLAHYTKDSRLLKVFEDNGDPHQMTADLIGQMGFHIKRKDAKQVNFGWAYGIGPKGLQDTIEKASGERPSMEDTKAWLDGFGKAYPDAQRWKWRVVDYATELGFVKTIGGRKRRLPEIRSEDKALRGSAQRQAVNSIIQGSASDVIKYAMLETDKLAQQYEATLLAQVHDELVWEVDQATVRDFAAVAQGIMEGAGDHFKIRVKLIAEPGIGPNWNEAKN